MDLTAVAVRAGARPIHFVRRHLGGTDDEGAAAIRRRASHPPDDLWTAMNALFDRMFFWLMLMVVHLPLGLPVALLTPEGSAQPFWDVSTATLIACGLTGVFVSFRLGIAWYTDEESWPRRARLLTSRDKDPLYAIVLVALGWTLLRYAE